MSRFFTSKALRKARPPLAVIAPLTHKIVWGIVFFNFWIGYSILEQKAIPLVVITNILTRKTWATIFALLGVWIFVGLRRNDWAIIRQAQAVGLFVKVVWTIALIQIGLQSGFDQVRGVIGLWLFAAWIQAVIIVYFVPTGRKVSNGNGS